MKKMCLGLGVYLLLVFLFSDNSQVYALSCAYTQPIVGTLKESDADQSIILEDVYTFEDEDFVSDGNISVDEYKQLVNSYINRDLSVLKTLTSHPLNSEYQVRVGKIALEKMSIEKGDVVVNGPPFHVCSYGFSGFFTPRGVIKYAVINDNYSDLTFKEDKLVVEQGNEVNCYGDTCRMEVEYRLNDKSFILTPESSIGDLSTHIKGITLINSSGTKTQIDGSKKTDIWGMNNYVNQVIFFGDDKIPEVNHSISRTFINRFIAFYSGFLRWFILVLGL